MPDETPIPVSSPFDVLKAELDKAFVAYMTTLDATIMAELERGSAQAALQMETFNTKVKEIIEAAYVSRQPTDASSPANAIGPDNAPSPALPAVAEP